MGVAGRRRGTSGVQGRLPGGRVVGIQVADEVVSHIIPAEPDGAELVVPGLLDLQVNGYGGVDFNDGALDADRVAQVVRAEWARGIPTICPTLVTGPEERILDALAAIAAARRADPLVRRAIACVHVEGPYLSAEDGPRGAHDPEFLRAPDVAELARWQRAAGGVVGIVTLAPEVPGALDYIKAASAEGVVVSVGHSAADRDQIAEAADAGATLCTHLGNGCAQLLPRHDNLLWPQLADDRLCAGFIADGHHLPADMFVAMTRAKGTDRSVLVSDSVALAGSPPGRYRTAVGGEVELSASRRLSLAGSGGRILAGSVSCLTECLEWAMRDAGLSAAAAFQMATVNPWRVLAGGTVVPGAAGRGQLHVGVPADLTVFEPDSRTGRLRVSKVVVAGVPVVPGVSAPTEPS